jgi:hypothetical protein
MYICNLTQRERIKHNLKILGFDTNKTLEDCVENLIEQHILMMQEIEQDNKEFFKRELRKVVTSPTN